MTDRRPTHTIDPRAATLGYQHQAEEHAGHHRDPIRRVAWEQGLGKSKCIIDKGCALHYEEGLDGILINAPSGVHRNWADNEIPSHLWPELRDRARVLCYNTDKAGNKSFKQEAAALLGHRGLAILCMSYDSYMTTAGRQLATRFAETRRCLQALDESSDIKTPSAKRTQAVIRTAWRANWKVIADGTPITQGPFDAYAPVKFLDEDFWKKRGMETFAEFKTRYGIWKKRHNSITGNEWGECTGYHRLDELREYLEPITSRKLKADCLDLPEKIYKKRPVDLNAEQRRVYESLRKDYVAELANGKTISTPLAIVRLLRMQQVLHGYVPTPDGEEPVHLLPGTNHRLEALAGEVAQSEGKVVIWAPWRLDVDLLTARLRKAGEDVVRFDGTLTQDELAANENAFKQPSSGPRIMVTTYSKGYRGYTWTVANTVLNYGHTPKLIQRLQSEDRTHRIGTTDVVTYTDFLAPGTVDEKQLEGLRKKFDVASQVNGDFLREWI